MCNVNVSSVHEQFSVCTGKGNHSKITQKYSSKKVFKIEVENQMLSCASSAWIYLLKSHKSELSNPR